MIDRLEKAHAKMLAREAGPELDGEQQTAAQVATLAEHAARPAACAIRDEGSSYHAFCSDPHCAACYGTRP